MLRFLAVFIVYLGIICLAQAQVPMTGAGRGSPTVAASYSGPGDVVASASVWWSADSCYSKTTNAQAIADLVDTSTGTVGTRLMCNTGGVVSALVSGSACTFVSGNACSSFATTCGAGPSYTCSVLKLYDQIGTACSGSCDLSDPLANAPALVGGVDGSTNTKCMLFATAAPTVLFGPALGTSISQPYTIIGVFERSAAFTTEGNILDWQNLSLDFPGSANLIGANGGAGLSGAVAQTDGHLHAVQFVMNDPAFGGTSSSQVDSTTNIGTVLTGPNGPNAGQTSALGGSLDFLSGYICEIGVWPVGFTTTPTTGQLALMNANMHSRNGF